MREGLTGQDVPDLTTSKLPEASRPSGLKSQPYPLVAAGELMTGFRRSSRPRITDRVERPRPTIPSGPYATSSIWAVWPEGGGVLACRRVPDPHGHVVAARDELQPIGLNATAWTREMWPTSV